MGSKYQEGSWDYLLTTIVAWEQSRNSSVIFFKAEMIKG